jgi:O-antigen/teichoic acid export membrane protein
MQIAAGIALSRVYGPAGKGLVTYAGIAILGVIAIADGLSSAIARQCGDDRARGPAACAAAGRIILVISTAVALPLIALGLLVPAQHALLYVGVALPFALYVQTMSSFHLVALRVERTNVASLAVNAGAASVMLLLTVIARPPIDVILGIWAAGYVAGAAIVHPRLGARAEPAAVRALISAQVPLVLRSASASLVTFFVSRVDVFIIAATLSASALGNYTLALACGELMWQIGRAMSWSAYGRVAIAPFARAAQLTATITRMVLAVELLAAIVAFLAVPEIFTLVYGPAFADAGLVLRFLIPGMALYAADSILSYFIAVKVGRPAVVLRVETLTLIACAAGSLATVGRFGMLGPSIVMSLAYLLSFAVKSSIFVRATGLSFRTLLLISPADFRVGESTPDRIGSAVA